MAERERPFTDMNDVVRRTGLTVPQGRWPPPGLRRLRLSRRQALWNAGYADSGSTLPGTAIDAAPPALPGMTDGRADPGRHLGDHDLPGDHPVRSAARCWTTTTSCPIVRLGEAYAERRVRVAGLVTHRQRPGTAAGITFLNLEDETGMLNVVCSQELWRRFGRVGRNAAGMVIRGRVEYNDGVTNLVAERLQPLSSVYRGRPACCPPVTAHGTSTSAGRQGSKGLIHLNAPKAAKSVSADTTAPHVDGQGGVELWDRSRHCRRSCPVPAGQVPGAEPSVPTLAPQVVLGESSPRMDTVCSVAAGTSNRCGQPSPDDRPRIVGRQRPREHPRWVAIRRNAPIVCHGRLSDADPKGRPDPVRASRVMRRRLSIEYSRTLASGSTGLIRAPPEPARSTSSRSSRTSATFATSRTAPMSRVGCS